ncbi:MAG: glycosyltransferase [Patescibacteria group bacterium]|nr:glycosyltransferase [Patescibacteria group bacterium]
MKILQIHKFFRQEGSGGSVGALFGLIDLLEKKGDKVMVFSTKDARNLFSNNEKYFVNSIPISRNDSTGLAEKLRLLGRIISSREAADKLEELIKKQGRPDIAHMHLITYHLTPSIVEVLKKHKIPIVQTLHDYQLICPNHKLLSQGEICERCKKKKYYQCFLNKCIQDSYFRSFAGMMERYYNRVFNDYAREIDLFIAPSRFMKEKVIEFGIEKKKVEVLMNYIFFDNKTRDRKDETGRRGERLNYALYFGRLVKEKGVDILIKSLKLVRDDFLKLVIAGIGPEEKELKRLTERLGLKNRVDFMGFKNKDDLALLIKRAKFVVYPSRWYENSPLTIYESMYFKRPVIASRIGGHPELIRPGVNGYLFKSGDAKALAEKVNLMTFEEARILGNRGGQWIRREMDQDSYYSNLISLYGRVIG